ncbi:oligosaccharide flippase family protein [Candidatus Competibacter phosphatis]|uniref:oligosaccharide flippase family protein n=1 Tax=Candidatus Competibacter phosphatis TaxID=221280 RepID=UPI00145DF1E5|nr:oligosaccharide flippase family protein [Candidatus Competibacter phosphatis]
MPWLILAVPMATLSGVLTGALQGRERFLELNLISVSSTVLFQLLPLAVARFWEVDLAVLLPAALCARLFTLLVLFIRCRRHIFQGHPATFARAQAEAGSLLRFGGWVTVTAFVGPMMVILDRFIIGALVGAKAVAFYTVPFHLGERSTLLSGALTFALFPRFAAVTPEERRRLAYTGLQVLAAVMTPAIAVGILLVEPFLAWWITPAFAEQSAPVGQILLLGFWANGFARISFAQLQAQGNPNRVAQCHLAEVLPYFALLYLGLHYFELVGAAAAFSLRVLVDFALLAGLAGWLPLALRLLWVPALLLALAFWIATQTLPGQPEWFGLAGLHGVLTGIWAWRQTPEWIRQATVARFRLFFRLPGKALRPS